MSWTKPYCGIQYRTDVSRRTHISVQQYPSFTIATYTDLDKNKHLHQSNFGHDISVCCDTVEEARLIAERW